MQNAIKIIEDNKFINCETLIVTKNQDIEDIKFLYDNGYRTFGENKLQEIVKKREVFPDASYHFIGRIQSNKIKKIVEVSDLIQSVSEIRYLAIINEEAQKMDKIQDVLLQFNISGEITKAGFKISDIDEIMELLEEFTNIRVRGIMLMGDHVDDELKIMTTFSMGYELFDELKPLMNHNFDILSMGMSNDYKLAIKCGSNMVRLGSILFKKGNS